MTTGDLALHGVLLLFLDLIPSSGSLPRDLFFLGPASLDQEAVAGDHNPSNCKPKHSDNGNDTESDTLGELGHWVTERDDRRHLESDTDEE